MAIPRSSLNRALTREQPSQYDWDRFLILRVIFSRQKITGPSDGSRGLPWSGVL
jgi:hypothetical protein